MVSVSCVVLSATEFSPFFSVVCEGALSTQTEMERTHVLQQISWKSLPFVSQSVSSSEVFEERLLHRQHRCLLTLRRSAIDS